jgi:hypothetical protein
MSKDNSESFDPTAGASDESEQPSLEQTPSREREVHDVNSGSIIAFDRSLSKSQLKAKMVEILDRGVTSSRLDLDVDTDIHYEWVPNNAVEKNRMKTLGFEVLSRKNHLRSGNPLHEGGGDEIIVGDVIAMGCSKARKEVLDEIKQERFTAMHGKAGSNVQGEETDFQKRMRESAEPAGVTAIVESSTQSIGGNELLNAIKPT